MSTVRIVPMRAEHLSSLATLEATCFADPWSEAALREELDNPCARFLVAVEGTQVVGYLGCHHVADEGFIANVAVHPAYRRRGIARALVQTAQQQATALSRLMLEVRQSNHAARALYASLGFTEDGIRPRFYTHPTEDAVLYSYYTE